MNSRIGLRSCGMAGAVNLFLATAAILFLATASLLGEAPDQEAEQSKPAEPIMTLDEARARAKLLHTTYESTLITVHRAYFEEGKRMMVPARVLEDVFYWVDQETHGKTRWISVNTEAMNINHEPKSEIEKKAAKALALGEEELEVIEDGVYHRASPITLVAACLRCHAPTNLFQKQQRKRVAGLVISIPIKQD